MCMRLLDFSDVSDGEVKIEPQNVELRNVEFRSVGSRLDRDVVIVGVDTR